MTPEKIVETALTERLQVIAITDHNQIGNVQAAVKYGDEHGVLVVPGVELSTPQGHLLVYCPTPIDLESFYGKLRFSADKKACHDTIPQCLNYADAHGGFGICAHIELDSGFEKAHPKFDVFKQEIFNCRNLLGLEVSNIDNRLWFSHEDDDPNRRNCVSLRCRHLGYEEDIELAKVMSSDAHSLGALGRNARGDRKLTRFKMESLTFESLRIALLDCAARVRLEDLIPSGVPRFVGMKLEGGFLNDQVVHFSRNLTCIIGGRGAGKSTMLESLRVASGNSVDNPIVDSDVWPDVITLVYEDEAGQRHILSRPKLKDVTNTDPNGPVRVAIESYGQGETAETIQHCDKDPSVLLTFLDGFVDIAQLKRDDELLRTQLLNNQTELERLLLDLKRIPEIENAKKVADGQVAALKSQKAGEVVALEQKLANERRFRDQLKGKLNELLTAVNECLSSDELRGLMNDMDGSTLAVGSAEFDAVKALLSELADDVDSLSKQVQNTVASVVAKISEQLKVWTAKEQETQAKIEEIRREFEKQKIKLDMAYIRKVTKDAADYAQKLEELRKSVPKQRDAVARRRELVKARRELKARMFTIRQAFATATNRSLASTVVDYRVSIKFHEGILSDEFESLIKDTMGWRTSQVPKAALIASTMSPMIMLDAINRKDASPIEAVLDAGGNPVFSKAEAEAILSALSDQRVRLAIQRCRFEDWPEIKVSKAIVKDDGSTVYPVKDFAQLSLGQQQSILLSILLFSKSKTPLIIDQPEDNLDSEFIYKTLVRSLRGIKEHRQVVIVTHNANIAVLGDAELIVPLRGASEFAVIRDRGSIDTTQTKEIVCTILEGSKKAFTRRQEVYGF